MHSLLTKYPPAYLSCDGDGKIPEYFSTVISQIYCWFKDGKVGQNGFGDWALTGWKDGV